MIDFCAYILLSFFILLITLLQLMMCGNKNAIETEEEELEYEEEEENVVSEADAPPAKPKGKKKQKRDKSEKEESVEEKEESNKKKKKKKSKDKEKKDVSEENPASQNEKPAEPAAPAPDDEPAPEEAKSKKKKKKYKKNKKKKKKEAEEAKMAKLAAKNVAPVEGCAYVSHIGVEPNLEERTQQHTFNIPPPDLNTAADFGNENPQAKNPADRIQNFRNRLIKQRGSQPKSEGPPPQKEWKVVIEGAQPQQVDQYLSINASPILEVVDPEPPVKATPPPPPAKAKAPAEKITAPKAKAQEGKINIKVGKKPPAKAEPTYLEATYTTSPIIKIKTTKSTKQPPAKAEPTYLEATYTTAPIIKVKKGKTTKKPPTKENLYYSGTENSSDSSN